MLDSRVAFSGGCCIQLFGNFTAQLLRQRRQLVCGLFHQRVLCRFLRQILQLIALCLFLLAEAADVIAGFPVEVLLGLCAELCGFGSVERQFLGQFAEGFQQLAICLLQCLQSEWCGGTGHLQDPRTLPDSLGSGVWSLVGGTSAQFEGIALLQPERFEIQPEVAGDCCGTFFEWLGRLNAEGILITAEVQFQ